MDMFTRTAKTMQLREMMSRAESMRGKTQTSAEPGTVKRKGAKAKPESHRDAFGFKAKAEQPESPEKAHRSTQKGTKSTGFVTK